MHLWGNIILEIFSSAINTLDVWKYLKLLLMSFDKENTHIDMDSKQCNKVMIRCNEQPADIQSHRPKYSGDRGGVEISEINPTG